MSSYHPGTELPVPDTEQIEHSSRLIEKIIQQIESVGGVISFREYMQCCLYQSGLGYYSAGSTKFGASGDFVTAPEISALFGQCLANQTKDLFEQGLDRYILEFGAGTGKLCVDIIQRLNKQGVDWLSYLILETSSDLQQRQQQFIKQRLSANDLNKIHWLSVSPTGFNGLVLGNEVLDAMPVNVVIKNDGWVELGVTFTEQKFEWTEFSRNSEAVQRIQQIDLHNNLPEHYCSEVNLNY
ncbi:MAG: SAM-dependent methyltransferase, partial [Gammaproteobacteria bacterium]|nr:SAM-dependent methyltransferase [Gammaproteobacteria bacterium]